MKFTAELESAGGNTGGFRVPQEVVDSLGGGKRPKVTVRVNGFDYRSSIAPMGGDNWLGVSQERRDAAGIAVGQTHEVELALDTAPRVIEVPDDLAEAFAAEPEAKAFWDTLSYSNQRWHAEQITGAKKPETRAKRVAKSVELLRDGRAR